MTVFENRALDALERASFRIASAGKRFRNDMSWERERARTANTEFKMTARQAMYLWTLTDVYRRQIKDEELKKYGAHARLTQELPPIYLEGDHREPVTRSKSTIIKPRKDLVSVTSAISETQQIGLFS